MDITLPECPCSVATSLSVSMLHNLIVVSSLPEAKNLPQKEKAKDVIPFACPLSVENVLFF
jgi:hypothetical protein